MFDVFEVARFREARRRLHLKILPCKFYGFCWMLCTRKHMICEIPIVMYFGWEAERKINCMLLQWVLTAVVTRVN
jgi:hypothetical protein